MSRLEELKRLDKKTRNRVRAIISTSDADAIIRLAKLRSGLVKTKADALEAIINGLRYEKVVQPSQPFPKLPAFVDKIQLQNNVNLDKLLSLIEEKTAAHKMRLLRIAFYFQQIDEAYAAGNTELCRDRIIESIELDGWSHALLRRIVLLRENLPDGREDDELEKLVQQANLNAVAVASLIHAYSLDQSILTIKRSILNISDRGAINRYSRTISKLTVQPFANSKDDLCAFLLEVKKCSLIDAIILLKFNRHLIEIEGYPSICEICNCLGQIELFEKLVATYDLNSSESEYVFFKQSSAWLEYEPVRQYRMLLDNYYDASREEVGAIHETLSKNLQNWIGDITLADLVAEKPFTRHSNPALTKLEQLGFATRSAIFNYWIHTTDGQISFEKDDLLKLMGLTRDLSRTVPIKATRTAAKLSPDPLVRLILLLLLAKRSKNEYDSFKLRKLLEETVCKNHNGSLIELVSSYATTHPYIAEYIYDIATEDFLAKLSQLAPHLADIPAIRASLHDWMATFHNDEYYRQRARAVRIDHQLNRVRNEIDDHRIYVDPSRFSSWLEDEMMIELNNALTSTGTGKKGVAVNCDETLLSLVMTQSYSAFCSNAIFGIASYIGRRIRHGTFHGHLYSSIINSVERSPKFEVLFQAQEFVEKWSCWKSRYNTSIEAIIRERLHVHSKAKPLGLLQPDLYGPNKQEILSAAVKSISTNFTETNTVLGIDKIIIDYCWRLAESDLLTVTKYLRAQQTPLKHLAFFEKEVLSTILPKNIKLGEAFQRELELLINRKLTAMFGWFKRPTIVAPKASVSLLFDAIAAEVRDTIPDFSLQASDPDEGDVELIGSVYHLVYDSLAVVVTNAARHGDISKPTKRRFQISQGKSKQLSVEITSSIRSNMEPKDVLEAIERRMKADFHDANLYQGKSGISKLKLLAHQRQDFSLEQYEVVGNEVKVRLVYALEH